MDWKDWIDRNVFVKLRSGAVYSGKVIDVDTSPKEFCFIEMIDKFGDKITICNSEIEKIKEEKR